MSNSGSLLIAWCIAKKELLFFALYMFAMTNLDLVAYLFKMVFLTYTSSQPKFFTIVYGLSAKKFFISEVLLLFSIVSTSIS